MDPNADRRPPTSPSTGATSAGTGGAAPHGTTETTHRAIGASDAVRSNAAVKGHPIHPMLIPLPIGFLVGALVADVVYAVQGDPFWARAAVWLLIGGIVTGLLAAVFGIVDYATIKRARQVAAGRWHAIGNGLVLVLATLNALGRADAQEGFITPWGLVLSLVTGVLLAVTGWLGGELSYRHLVGVNPHGKAPAYRNLE